MEENSGTLLEIEDKPLFNPRGKKNERCRGASEAQEGKKHCVSSHRCIIFAGVRSHTSPQCHWGNQPEYFTDDPGLFYFNRAGLGCRFPVAMCVTVEVTLDSCYSLGTCPTR